MKNNKQTEFSKNLHSLLNEHNKLVEANPSWKSNISDLMRCIQTDSIENFLKWDVIRKTMFVRTRPYIVKEFMFLLKNNWSQWKVLLEENKIGNPPKFFLYPKTSSNLIHHVYHVAVFFQKTGVHLNEINSILEFGGGYGSMCRVFRKLGFEGQYYIFDLPQFSALQHYYLQSLGFRSYFNDLSVKTNKKDNYCIYDIKLLKKIGQKKDNFKTKKRLFIATWSLSESPLSIRNDVIPLIKNYDYYLIAYQKTFDEIDNLHFFKTFVENISKVNPKIKWIHFQIPHIKDNYYLFGYK